MNITSQYSIARYNGKEYFSLVNPPNSRSTVNGITIVNPDYIKYYEFLNTVEKVYDTQLSPKGNIPIFWTVSSGNTYVPSSDSTLSGLAPGKTYYFVSRSEADLPISVPLISGILIENVGINTCSGIDYDCCPSFTSIGSTGLNSPDIVLNSASGNYYYMSIGLNNLIPNKSYFYNISSFNSNWPTFVNPKSGIYTPSSSSGNIEAVIHFALDTDNNVGNLPYTYDINASLKDKYNLLNIYVSGINTDSNCKPISKAISVRCYDCLPKTDCPNVIFTNSPNLVLASDCCSSNQPLSVSVSDAVPGREYTYSFLASSGISITSSPTGSVVFGSTGAGRINTTFNMYNTSVGIIQTILTDTYSNKKVMDFLSTNCGSCENTSGGGTTPIYTVSDLSVYTIDTTQNENYLFDRISYANNSWFVPCNDTSGGDYYLKSSDAITWNKYLTLGQAGNWSSIVYGNNKYVIFNNANKKIHYSSDGESWTIANFTASSLSFGTGTYELFFINGKFRLFGSSYGINYYSSDGITWTLGTSLTGNNNLINSTLVWEKLNYLNNKLILVGSNTSSTWIYVSDNDGTSWSPVASLDGVNIGYITSGTLLNKNSIFYTNSTYYIGLSDKIISSSNGTAWTTTYNPSQTINSLSYNNTNFIADIAGITSAKFSVSSDSTNYIIRYPVDIYTNGSTYNVNNKFLSIARNGTFYGHLDGLDLYKLPTNFSSSTIWNNTDALIANNKVVLYSVADKKIASFSIT
jgi:hypothetical protein